jgi:hypothetical protein
MNAKIKAITLVLVTITTTTLAGIYCQETVTTFTVNFSFVPTTKQLIIKDNYNLSCKYAIPTGTDPCQFPHIYSAYYKLPNTNVEIEIPMPTQLHTHYLPCKQATNKTESHNLGNLCELSKGQPVTIRDQIFLGPLPVATKPNMTKSITKTYTLTCPMTIIPITHVTNPQ